MNAPGTGPSMFVPARWLFDAPDPALTGTLARTANIPAWIAGMLVKRGLHDPAALESWLSPKLASLKDPFLLPDMEAAVARALRGIERSERITVFGDYDVDGLTSTAMLAGVLAATGTPVATFLPHRMEEGYGLSPDALARCIEETRPQLIITVDCGTSSVAAVQAAREAGIDIIITDHHEPGGEIAPAVAVVNPRRSDDASQHVLAGVGVAFKFIHALLKRARTLPACETWANMDPRELLDLVALGTVADMVPLLHENRILVSHGLKRLDRTTRTGLRALIEVAEIDKSIGTYEVGFMLGPRLNAAGRLDSARAALDLLMTRDPALAEQNARLLDAANRERRAVEKEIVVDLLDRVDDRLRRGDWHAIVEADESWHPGVVGLAATRAMQRHHRPAIVIGADDRERAKGSGRSVPGFNLVEALAECREHLIKHGGHAMAAGLEIAWDRVDAFREKFNEVARRRLAGQVLAPQHQIDGWIDPGEVDDAAMDLLGKLGPFGTGYPEPLWASRELQWVQPPREVGTGHLKGRLHREGRALDCIGFGMFRPDWPQAPLEAVYHLKRDSFRGRETITMHLKDIRPAN